MSSAIAIEVAGSIAQLPAAEWNALADGDPFLSHAFLNALHESGCADPATGWAPCYLLMRDNGRLSGAMPLYLKSHSWGEYVFDWAWADAYRRHGLAYYPKLVNAVPFTPVTGRRLLASTPAGRARLLDAAFRLARETGASSLHCLFPTEEDAADMRAADMMVRHGVQFHWRNRGYADFDAMLADMGRDKRKKIRQERRRVRDAGIRFEWREGADIDDGLWRFFYRCYRNTYARHGSTPYLSLDFFREIGRALAAHLLLVVALRGEEPVAASLNVRDGGRLCGRYWGTLEYHDGLHFETCYYQTIEFCIARGIPLFEGGAQGEHKVARGLLPERTLSAHWLDHPEFAAAVEDFLRRESEGITQYMDELDGHSPFRPGSQEP